MDISQFNCSMIFQHIFIQNLIFFFFTFKFAKKKKTQINSIPCAM